MLKQLCLLALLSLTPLAWAAPTPVSALELQVVEEVNLLRTHPERYRARLEKLRGSYHDLVFSRPGEAVPMITKEGWPAVEEAIRYLAEQKPVGSVTLSAGLCLAASDHVLDQGRTSQTGHAGTDGSSPSDRMTRYGSLAGGGENIAYGQVTASGIVEGLVVDDGVPNRGHRTNLFNPAWTLIGIASGSHQGYRTMCVMDLAAGYSENQPAQAKRPLSVSSPQQPNRALPKRPVTGNAFQQARAVADQNYQAAANADRESWSSTFSRSKRGALATLWATARPRSAGATYQFSSAPAVASQRIQLLYLRRAGPAPAEKSFITVILENGQWVVEEVSY